MTERTGALLFDDGLGRLTPLTDLRSASLVRTGALTTLERHRLMLPKMGVEVRGVWTAPIHAEVTAESTDLPVNLLSPAAGDVVLINSRCVLPPPELSKLAAGEAILNQAGSVVAVKMSVALALGYLARPVDGLPPGMITRQVDARVLERPWDVIRHRDACLDADLLLLAGSVTSAAGGGSQVPAGVIAIDARRVHIHSSARVSASVVLDAEGGPIVIGEGVVIRPGVIIVGPAYIGPGSSVLERAFIKPHTAIGPVCKVTGEIGGCIFQGYANKGHEGHLGDSYVGEWVNFGAGTTNSNLLNTYGEVTATVPVPGAARERTGIVYLGCVVGDHTKFAICTRIMTGSVFGTGCMVATTAAPPTSVRAFSWLTDERAQPYRFAKFMDVAKTAMARRKVVPSAAYEALLRGLCDRMAG